MTFKADGAFVLDTVNEIHEFTFNRALDRKCTKTKYEVYLIGGGGGGGGVYINFILSNM